MSSRHLYCDFCNQRITKHIKETTCPDCGAPIKKAQYLADKKSDATQENVAEFFVYSIASLGGLAWQVVLGGLSIILWLMLPTFVFFDHRSTSVIADTLFLFLLFSLCFFPFLKINLKTNWHPFPEYGTFLPVVGIIATAICAFVFFMALGLPIRAKIFLIISAIIAIMWFVFLFNTRSEKNEKAAKEKEENRK